MSVHIGDAESSSFGSASTVTGNGSCQWWTLRAGTVSTGENTQERALTGTRVGAATLCGAGAGRQSE